MNTQEMDRLALIRRAGAAAGILMRMETRRLGDQFSVPLTSVNQSEEASDKSKGYALHASRDGGERDDALDRALYAAMAPHLQAAIVAARVALLAVVGAATKEETR